MTNEPELPFSIVYTLRTPLKGLRAPLNDGKAEIMPVVKGLVSILFLMYYLPPCLLSSSWQCCF